MRTRTLRDKWFFVAPGGLFLILMSIFPLVFSIYLAFCKWQTSSGGIKFYGLKNFQKLFTDVRFSESLLRTIEYIVLTVAFQIILGLLLALVLHYLQNRYSKVLRIFVTLPILLTPIGMAHIWRIMLDFSSGPVNYLIGSFGLGQVMWLGNAQIAPFSIVLVDVWQWMPFVALFMYTALESQNTELREAAVVDGAGGIKLLRYVIMPLLKPYIASITMLRLIDAIKIFDTIYILTSGGPGSATENITIYAYNAHFRTFNIGYMSAMGWVLVIIANIAFMILIRITKPNKAE